MRHYRRKRKTEKEERETGKGRGGWSYVLCVGIRRLNSRRGVREVAGGATAPHMVVMDFGLHTRNVHGQK